MWWIIFDPPNKHISIREYAYLEFVSFLKHAKDNIAKKLGVNIACWLDPNAFNLLGWEVLCQPTKLTQVLLESFMKL